MLFKGPVVYNLATLELLLPKPIDSFPFFSNEGFLVYFNGLRNEPMFNKQLKFELHLIGLECNDKWVEETVIEATKLLQINDLPSASKRCSTCSYLKDRWKVKQQID